MSFSSKSACDETCFGTAVSSQTMYCMYSPPQAPHPSLRETNHGLRADIGIGFESGEASDLLGGRRRGYVGGGGKEMGVRTDEI